VEAASSILSNPVVMGLLTGVASSAAYDTVKKVTNHLMYHLKEKPQVFAKEDVERTEKHIAGLFQKYDEGLWGTVEGAFWDQLQQFLFQNQRIDFEDLDEPHWKYVAERLFYGISFQSMLIELGCKKENVKYMFAFPSDRLGSPYYFDVKAKNEFHCIDQLVVARVVDNRITNPIDLIQAIPVTIDEINSATSVSHFRDFDLYVIIHSGQYDPETCMRIKGILKKYQTGQYEMPRFAYFEKQDLDKLMTSDKGERVLALKHEFANLKIDRRV
jgi:hypothetical protein